LLPTVQPRNAFELPKERKETAAMFTLAMNIDLLTCTQGTEPVYRARVCFVRDKLIVNLPRVHSRLQRKQRRPDVRDEVLREHALRRQGRRDLSEQSRLPG
jgi:hypothetical protein